MRAGWSSAAEAELDKASRAGYEAWLRVRISPSTETEINVQLGELTLKRHYMQLLEPEVSCHGDFLEVFGEQATRDQT